MNNQENSFDLIRKIDTGTACSLANGCIDPETGAEGDWLFTGDSHEVAGSRVSPVFGDLYSLFSWINSGRRFIQSPDSCTGNLKYIYSPTVHLVWSFLYSQETVDF